MKVPSPKNQTFSREAVGRLRQCRAGRSHRAFSLVELLVVIAIIGVLAALTVTGLKSYGGKKVRSRAEAEMEGMKTAIEGYHAKKGFYPPDNPGKPAQNTLYYELIGTTNQADGKTFSTITGNETISSVNVNTAFGTSGFMNSPDPEEVKSYYPNLRSSQISEATINGVKVKVLGTPIKGPSGNFSPWQYNSSKPVHNPSAYDLWVEVLIGRETNVLGNWK